jgi:single-stranded DNA-binding protein
MSKLAISVEGYIANELSIRDVTGHRVVDISVPHTPRKQVNGNWEDAGPTEWLRATFWDEHADAVLMAAQKGSLVTLTGGLKAGTYQRNNGDVGVSLEVTFPVLAVVVKRPARGQQAQAPAEQQWATQAPASTDTWNQGGGNYGDDTPF